VPTVIAYLRVSTKAQEASGLGLEAQRAAVESYARQSGSDLANAYTEVETGKLADRPELARALAHCRRSKATLVVAKLDRLARNVAFLSALMDSKVPFLACDNPHANRLTLHILAAVAEAEALIAQGRVETGAVQFGEDWPGLFVRGDDCMGLAGSIRRVLEALDPEQVRELAASAIPLREVREMIEGHVLVK